MINSQFSIGKDFLEKYDLMIVERGQYLWKSGDEIQYLYYIQSGICAAVEWQFNGALYIPLFYQKNEMIGLLTVLGENVQRIAARDIVAKTKVHVYKIPIDDVRDYIHSDFEIYKKAANSVLNAETEILELFQMKVKGNSVALVCNAMIMLKMKNEKVGDYFVPPHFNITDIASNLQIHRVTVSKIIKCLCVRNVLKKESYGWHILDLSELEKYASGEKNLENIYPKYNLKSNE